MFFLILTSFFFFFFPYLLLLDKMISSRDDLFLRSERAKCVPCAVIIGKKGAAFVWSLVILKITPEVAVGQGLDKLSEDRQKQVRAKRCADRHQG